MAAPIVDRRPPCLLATEASSDRGCQRLILFLGVVIGCWPHPAENDGMGLVCPNPPLLLSSSTQQRGASAARCLTAPPRGASRLPPCGGHLVFSYEEQMRMLCPSGRGAPPERLHAFSGSSGPVYWATACLDCGSILALRQQLIWQYPGIETTIKESLVAARRRVQGGANTGDTGWKWRGQRLFRQPPCLATVLVQLA